MTSVRTFLYTIVLGTALAGLPTGCTTPALRVPIGTASRSPAPAKTSQPTKHIQEDAEPVTLNESSTLADYLAYAAINNAGLEAAFNTWKAELERQPQVTALPDPRFTYRYFIREVETRVGPQRQAFGLSQTFPWLAKLDLEGDIAAQGALAARQRYESRKLALFHSVRDAYCELYYVGKAISIVEENVRLVGHLESVARAKYKTATASHPDVIRAQIELGTLEDRLAAMNDLRAPLTAKLIAALNAQPGSDIPLKHIV